MHARATNLPVPDVGGEVVVLDRATVVRGVRAANVELGAGVRELEAEDILLRGALCDRSREERVLHTNTVAVR